jgi:hypothetical protein
LGDIDSSADKRVRVGVVRRATARAEEDLIRESLRRSAFHASLSSSSTAFDWRDSQEDGHLRAWFAFSTASAKERALARHVAEWAAGCGFAPDADFDPSRLSREARWCVGPLIATSPGDGRRIWILAGFGVTALAAAAVVLFAWPRDLRMGKGGWKLGEDIRVELTARTDLGESACASTDQVKGLRCGYAAPDAPSPAGSSPLADPGVMLPFLDAQGVPFLAAGALQQPKIREQVTAVQDKPRTLKIRCSMRVDGELGSFQVRWGSASMWERHGRWAVGRLSACEL